MAIPAAFGQDESGLPEGDVAIDIDTRFISTYRDGSWVPIDVIVNNNQRDIEGYLEIATLTAGVKQNPVYRVAVDSPKRSRKRFRLYCKLDGATDLEAMLYRGDRPVIGAPMKIALRPIMENDILCLVLDNRPAEYGFLYSAVLDPDDDRGLYRVELTGSELDALPEYPICYDGIDLIVLGELDPNDISRRHRALIQRYVEGGGVLAVCLGANTARYRGTWVEELAGVTIGPQNVMTESALAQAVLHSGSGGQVRAGVDCEYADLGPNRLDVLQWGNNQTLATLRPLQNGYVAALAIDIPSKVLHANEEYQKLWTDLATARARRGEINTAGISQLVQAQLPNITGIRVFPRSSVATYLTIYLLVAIVGNWVFWSILKRREMAWVCLVGFSIAFTAYAMIYGTAGRAKESELEQVDVLRVRDFTPVAPMHSIVGVLSARSTRYSFPLAYDGALVSDIGTAFDPYGIGRRRTGFGELSGGGQDHYGFQQGAPPWLADFRVGASVMRLFNVESEIALPGVITGELVLDEEGLRGTLVNSTGLAIQSPFIYYRGGRIALEPQRDEWQVDKTAESVKHELDRSRNAWQEAPNQFYGYWGYQSGQVTARFDDNMKRMVEFNAFMNARSVGEPDRGVGPFLCGWVTENPIGLATKDERLKPSIRETFVVADIRILERDRQTESTPLEVLIDGTPPPNLMDSRRFGYMDWNQMAMAIQFLPGRDAASDDNLPLTIAEAELVISRELAENAVGPLDIQFDWYEQSNLQLTFVPDGGDANWSTAEPVPANRTILGMNVQSKRYVVEDWKRFYDAEAGAIKGHIQVQGALPGVRGGRPDARQMIWAQVLLRATLETTRNTAIAEEWQPWP